MKRPIFNYLLVYVNVSQLQPVLLAKLWETEAKIFSFFQNFDEVAYQITPGV